MTGNANSGPQRYRYPHSVSHAVCAVVTDRAHYERVRNAAYFRARQNGEVVRIRRDGELVVIRRER